MTKEQIKKKLIKIHGQQVEKWPEVMIEDELDRVFTEKKRIPRRATVVSRNKEGNNNGK